MMEEVAAAGDGWQSLSADTPNILYLCCGNASVSSPDTCFRKESIVDVQFEGKRPSTMFLPPPHFFQLRSRLRPSAEGVSKPDGCHGDALDPGLINNSLIRLQLGPDVDNLLFICSFAEATVTPGSREICLTFACPFIISSFCVGRECKWTFPHLLFCSRKRLMRGCCFSWNTNPTFPCPRWGRRSSQSALTLSRNRLETWGISHVKVALCSTSLSLARDADASRLWKSAELGLFRLSFTKK